MAHVSNKRTRSKGGRCSSQNPTSFSNPNCTTTDNSRAERPTVMGKALPTTRGLGTKDSDAASDVSVVATAAASDVIESTSTSDSATSSSVYVFDFTSQDAKSRRGHGSSSRSDRRDDGYHDDLTCCSSPEPRKAHGTATCAGSSRNKNSLFNGGAKSRDRRYMRLEDDEDREQTTVTDKPSEDSPDVLQACSNNGPNLASDTTFGGHGASDCVTRNMAHQGSGADLEEDETVMLGNFPHEDPGRKMNVVKKMAHALRTSNDKRQWCAIFVLLAIVFIVITLFFLL